MFRKVRPEAKLPRASTKYSVGYDLYYSPEEKKPVTIQPGEIKLLETGIALNQYLVRKKLNLEEIYLEVHPRSSMRVKGLTSLGAGIIDIDYPDEIKVVIMNLGKEPVTINPGDKIAQLLIKRHEGYKVLGKKYRDFKERVGGFGSTGGKLYVCEK